MEVKVIVEKDWNDQDKHTIQIDGYKHDTIGALCECPEDAIIGRDLIAGHEILMYMRKAYEAGKNGEKFIELWEEVK